MTTTDRYVFAKVDSDAGPKALHLTKPTTIPAPSPEDWQAIEEAYLHRGAIPTWEAVDRAVRNMREAQQ